MLSKCANPGCTALFRYLHQGKLFRLDASSEEPASQSTKKPARRVEYFWLCDECAARVTLHYKSDVGITLESVSTALMRIVSASPGM
jgi:hypothetical protein